MRLPGSAVYPRFRPLRSSRRPEGYAVTPAPGGRDLHPQGKLSSKGHTYLAVYPEASASFRPTGRTSLYAVWITPSPCARRRSGSTRAGVPSTRRRSVAPPRRRSYRLTTWAMQIGRHGRNRGRPPVPVYTGSRRVARMARMENTKPSVPNNSGRCAAQRRTRSISRRIRGRSRCSLTSPPSYTRVVTLMASALDTMPPCVLRRSSSACTCPKSRG